jgi:hypothetical protein
MHRLHSQGQLSNNRSRLCLSIPQEWEVLARNLPQQAADSRLEPRNHHRQLMRHLPQVMGRHHQGMEHRHQGMEHHHQQVINSRRSTYSLHLTAPDHLRSFRTIPIQAPPATSHRVLSRPLVAQLHHILRIPANAHPAHHRLTMPLQRAVQCQVLVVYQLPLGNIPILPHQLSRHSHPCDQSLA